MHERDYYKEEQLWRSDVKTFGWAILEHWIAWIGGGVMTFLSFAVALKSQDLPVWILIVVGIAGGFVVSSFSAWRADRRKAEAMLRKEHGELEEAQSQVIAIQVSLDALIRANDQTRIKACNDVLDETIKRLRIGFDPLVALLESKVEELRSSGEVEWVCNELVKNGHEHPLGMLHSISPNPTLHEDVLEYLKAVKRSPEEIITPVDHYKFLWRWAMMHNWIPAHYADREDDDVVELHSNPRIESVVDSRVEAEKGSKTMVSIHDLIALSLFDENCRCVEPSCPLYELPREEKALSRLSFLEFCDGCKAAMNVTVDDPLDPLLRTWAKAGEVTRDWVPIPRELTDRLDRMSVEILVPEGPECEVAGTMERPSVSLDEGSQPDVEDGIGHGDKEPSSNFNRHRLTHITRPSESDPRMSDSQPSPTSTEYP